MNSARCVIRTAVALLLFAASAPLLAANIGAQELPVNKPTSSGTRLAAPRTVVVTQESDGRIRVVWSGVPGAAMYSIVRSVPPTPAKQLDFNPTDTVFIDSDVVAGNTYYYTVAAVTDGAVGMRRGGNAVKAVISAQAGSGSDAGPGVVTPTEVAAVDGIQPQWALVRWNYGGRAGLKFLVEMKKLADTKAGWVVAAEPSSQPTTAAPRMGEYSFNLSSLPVGTEVVYRVTAIDAATGVRSRAVESNVFKVPPYVAPKVTAWRELVTVPDSREVHVGQSVGLLDYGAANARFISLNESIGTVEGLLLVARAPGRLQIVVIAPQTSGSVWLSVAQFNVLP